MTEEQKGRNLRENKATKYWASMAFKVRDGIKMHKLTGQLEKGVDTFRNVTEHCLVQVARSEVLGRWVGLSDDLISDMRMGAMLHDFDKKQQITVTREANRVDISPLVEVRKEEGIAKEVLETAGVSERISGLARACGGDVSQLLEAQRILD